LLYIKDISTQEKYENDFLKFNSLLQDILKGKIVKKKTGELFLFGQPFENMKLSPGQQYLLRLCVTLHCHTTETSGDTQAKVIFIDEPEIHLHPRVLIDIIKYIRQNFQKSQIWIATHSISLLSTYETTDIWSMANGKPKRMGSNSQAVLNGLLSENTDDNDYRSKLEQFVALP
jgi:predicted ATPase